MPAPPELLRTVIQETPLVIYAKDLDRRFVLSNRMHGLLVERPAVEVLGRTDTELFGDAAAEVEANTARVLAERVAIASEYTLPVVGELRTYLETIFPLRNEAGEIIGAGGIATDITARRALEAALEDRANELERTLAALRAAQSELVRTEKMAALGALAATVAHEVNTPLGVGLTAATVLQDLVDTLAERADSGTLTRDTLHASLRDARDAASLAVLSLQRAGRLVTSLQQVAVDRSTPDLRTTALSTWLAELEDSLRPLARQSGVSLAFRLEGDHALVFAAGELQQALSNLVVNAAGHGFSSWEGAPSERRVSVVVVLGNETLTISVVDNGCGMPADVAARAVEPFFTTRPIGGGSGLGLHVAHAIAVERFAGALDIDTAPGRGTSIRLVLPLGTPALALMEP